ncbi:hypothetical protein [Aurantiacibacter poecillastricola]|uniref:hypothetical protein n=1 Tax=Aurantiacibacter poecillastricola TaxID=3064385 RepID=UPI00273FD9B2|nr:hypothetical protein [Aurantiacibacter sp. 219JJ12-13]MDP5260994.1 hypothetical protein [Aurantiacibacter sp. 219JJ12-13]
MIGSLRKKPEAKRYLVRIATAMMIYLVSLAGCEWLIEGRGLSGAPAFALAALPGIAFAAVPWIFTRLIVEEQDEYLRFLYVRQVMVATGLTLTAAAIWGFLETYMDLPHVPAFWWPTIWCLGLGVGAIVNKVTMGSAGECL